MLISLQSESARPVEKHPYVMFRTWLELLSVKRSELFTQHVQCSLNSGQRPRNPYPVKTNSPTFHVSQHGREENFQLPIRLQQSLISEYTLDEYGTKPPHVVRILYQLPVENFRVINLEDLLVQDRIRFLKILLHQSPEDKTPPILAEIRLWREQEVRSKRNVEKHLGVKLNPMHQKPDRDLFESMYDYSSFSVREENVRDRPHLLDGEV